MHHLIQLLLSYAPVRFLISGGLSAVVHIGIVFVLSHIFSVWYLYATILGFLSAVGFSFIMQKFFTFRNMDKNAMKRQLFFFFIIASINFVSNGALMVLFVEYIGLIPVIAQIMTSGLIAVWSFIVYGKLFRQT
jgi:putative flippase GtrA